MDPGAVRHHPVFVAVELGIVLVPVWCRDGSAARYQTNRRESALIFGERAVGINQVVVIVDKRLVCRERRDPNVMAPITLEVVAEPLDE